jgi:hypothetical protein
MPEQDLATITEHAKRAARDVVIAFDYNTVEARRELVLVYGRDLCAIRQQFASNEKFGQHLVSHGLDIKDMPWRANAMRLARYEAFLAPVLGTCPCAHPVKVWQWLRDSREAEVTAALEQIEAAEAAEREQAGRPPRRSGRQRRDPAQPRQPRQPRETGRDRAEAILRQRVEAGERVRDIPESEVAAEIGISDRVVRHSRERIEHEMQAREQLLAEQAAAAAEEAERQVAEQEIDASHLPPDEQERFAALKARLQAKFEVKQAQLERHRRALEREFAHKEAAMVDVIYAQVRTEVRRIIEEQVLPVHAERLRLAEMIQRNGRKPLTKAEYQLLQFALHPDTSDEQRRHLAFNLIIEKRLLLSPVEEKNPLTEGLPKTIEELRARRQSSPPPPPRRSNGAPPA